MNLYEALGVEPTATAEEIRAAYRALAREHHPDMGGDGERMAAVNTAYAVLSDPERRAAYDATGEADAAAQIEREARETLAHMLSQGLESSGDLLANVLRAIDASRSNAAAAKANFERRASALRARRGKITRADGGENLVVHLIDQALQQIEAERERAEKAVKVFDAAEEMLSAYSSTEAMPPQMFIGTGTSTGTGTGWIRLG